MNTKVACAFAAGIVVGLLAATTSGLRVNGQSPEEAGVAERKRCYDLLAHRAAHMRKTGAEEAERLRQRLKEQHGKDMLPPDFLPDKKTIEALEHMRDAVEQGVAAP